MRTTGASETRDLKLTGRRLSNQTESCVNAPCAKWAYSD